MKIKAGRSCLVGGCLATVVLTASGTLLARSASAPTFGLCTVDRNQMGTLTFGAPSELFPGAAPSRLVSINAMAPWFRGTVVPFRIDGVCLMATSVKTPVSEQRAVTELPPGVVQNLRRTD
jgi:hypothetical protein